MSREKQIEEMAETLAEMCDLDLLADCDEKDCSKCMATALYNIGYRKQSEGEWVIKWRSTFPQYEPSEYQCSVCGLVRTVKHKYCPNCGSKMKGV